MDVFILPSLFADMESARKCIRMAKIPGTSLVQFVVYSLRIYVYTYIYIYIVVHRYIVSLYPNSLVWLDPRDASGWDRKTTDLTSVGHLNTEPSSVSCLVYESFTYNCLHIRYRQSGVFNSWEDQLHYSLWGSRQTLN